MIILAGALCGLVFATGVLVALRGLIGVRAGGPRSGAAGLSGAPGLGSAELSGAPGFAGFGFHDPVAVRLLSGAVVVGVVIFAVTGWFAPGIVGGAAIWIIPHTMRTRARWRLERARLRALAGWIEVIRDLFGAGAGLQDALVSSQRHIAPVIADDVGELVVATTMHGARRSLVRFGERFESPIADQVVWALMIAAERSSGAVSDVLSQAARQARERVALQERIDAKRATRFMVVNTMIVMTVLLGAALVAINPVYRDYYATFGGQVVLTAIVMLQGAGFVWLLSMSKHETGHRIAVTEAGF